MKRPKTIWFLIIITFWSVGKNLESLIFYNNSPNYLILASLEQTHLNFLALAILLILGGSFLYFLLKPSPNGFWVGVVNIMVGMGSAFWGTQLLINNPEVAKQAILLNRQEKGLPVTMEKVEAVISPAMAYGTLGIMIGFSVFCLLLLIWKREYFAGK